MAPRRGREPTDIAGIEFIPLSAALPDGRAYGMSKSLATARQTTLVRLRLADGTEGVGEAWGIPAVNLDPRSREGATGQKPETVTGDIEFRSALP